MTVSLQTLLDRSNRNMATGTHPVVRESALEMIRRAYREGIYVQISEGHRSYARQNDLYAQGRTRPGNIVTNARGGQSWHNFGIAVDFFLVSDDGQRAIWTVNNKWRRAAQIAKQLGFEWGGDWTSFVDYPHLQMTGGLTLAQLRAGRKPNLVSRVNSSTAASIKSYLEQGDTGSQVSEFQQKLKDIGYAIDVDGSFGPAMLSVVRRFQSDNNLVVDGYLGPATQKKLNEILIAQKKKPTPKPKQKEVDSLTKYMDEILPPTQKNDAAKLFEQAYIDDYFEVNHAPNTRNMTRRQYYDLKESLKTREKLNFKVKRDAKGLAEKEKFLQSRK